MEMSRLTHLKTLRPEDFRNATLQSHLPKTTTADHPEARSQARPPRKEVRFQKRLGGPAVFPGHP